MKFTCEYSSEKVNHLDVKVIVREGRLITDLYVKQTDSHQYLDPSSCHSYHCTKSIPYSQALSINRICSENVSVDLLCKREIILALKMLFLNLYVLAKSIILRAEAAMLHILVKPLGT